MTVKTKEAAMSGPFPEVFLLRGWHRMESFECRTYLTLKAGFGNPRQAS
jgi:hypothetical protein